MIGCQSHWRYTNTYVFWLLSVIIIKSYIDTTITIIDSLLLYVLHLQIIVEKKKDISIARDFKAFTK